MAKQKKKRDETGAIRGSRGAKVNAALTNKWQTVDEIAKKVRGLTRTQVINRLHFGRRMGIYEYESVVKFRLKKK